MFPPMGPQTAVDALDAALDHAATAVQRVAAAGPREWRGPASRQYEQRVLEVLDRCHEAIAAIEQARRVTQAFVAETAIWGTVL